MSGPLQRHCGGPCQQGRFPCPCEVACTSRRRALRDALVSAALVAACAAVALLLTPF